MTAGPRVFRWVAGLALALLVSHGALGADPPPVPMSTFFRNADLSAAHLSPSGRWLAIATVTRSGRIGLATMDLDGSAPPAFVASYVDADIGWFQWVGDERLLYSTIDLKMGGAEQTFRGAIHSVSRAGKDVKFLTSRRSLLWTSGTGGDEVILGDHRFDARGELLHVHPVRVHLSTGSEEPVAMHYPDRTVDWVFDSKGRARVAVSLDHGQLSIFWREGQTDVWRLLDRSSSVARNWYPLFVDSHDRLYVLAPSKESTQVLKRFDFSTNALDPEALVATPGFDFQGAVLSRTGSGDVVGVRVDTDAETTVWLDPEMKAKQAMVDARYPGRINRLECARCTVDGSLLVTSYSDRDPGSYFVYRPATQNWIDVGRVRKDVDPARMAVLDLHRIKARDGADLPVWVTQPSAAIHRPAAAVVLVHGGPWVRGGHWHWDQDAQFLASRGYVVIEPEFRGSTGYGMNHLQRGFKQWGGAMQDDVADAVRWAMGKGLVDPKRICIAGASYGGYAVLMGTILYPDLYRCGVAWLAVGDPRLVMENRWNTIVSEEARAFSLPLMIGDSDREAKMLDAASPIERAAEIEIPLLLAFGGRDARVPLDHAMKLRSALQRAGKTPEWVVYEGEGHGWMKVDNRLDFWGRVEAFLAKNLN